jgi:4-hydroxythreonine-4-phosphate dehydrogenase
VLELTAAHFGLTIPCAVVDVSARLPAPARDAIAALTAIPFGTLFPAFGHLQNIALRVAIEDALAGTIAAICTAPLHKALMAQAGLPMTGHTEILGEACGVRPVMMLAGDKMRVSLVTTHIPLRQVADALDPQGLDYTIDVTVRWLTTQFGIAQPRVAVCGLNPHAGEAGKMGTEDRDLVAPAVARACAAGHDVVGPLPADTLFSRYGGDGPAPFDAVVAMYHDQGLIPLKLLHFGRAANITLGLPIVRTSVDHGTAHDIAGTVLADTGSLEYALELARRLSRQP